MSGDQFRQIPQLRPYRPVTLGNLSSLGVVAEQDVPDEDDVVHNGIGNHQFKNSKSFHLTFGHLIARRKSDGLMVRATTRNFIGVSNFTLSVLFALGLLSRFGSRVEGLESLSHLVEFGFEVV